jgi:hypothetical protein
MQVQDYATVFAYRVEELSGESEQSLFAFARTLEDQWAYIESVLSDAKEEHLDTDYPEEFEAFANKAQDFMDTVDSALTSPERQRVQYDRWNEIDWEPVISSDSYDPGYSPRQRFRDVRGLDTPEFQQPALRTPSGETDPKYSSRNIWKRTKGHTKHTYSLSEWGHFSFDVSKKYSESLLRVTYHRKFDKPYLRVGGVDISLLSGTVVCHVSGCKFKRRLQYNAEGGTEFDREYAEYQILSILAHLGEHTLKNPRNYWTPILEIKRFRDDKDALAAQLKRTRPVGRKNQPVKVKVSIASQQHSLVTTEQLASLVQRFNG